MSSRAPSSEMLRLSLDAYIDSFVANRIDEYMQREGNNPHGTYYSLNLERQHRERVQNMRQERLLRQRLEDQNIELNRLRRLCRKLKRKQRQNANEMRQMHAHVLQKYWERVQELRQLEKERQKHRELKQRLMAIRRAQRLNRRVFNVDLEEPSTLDEDMKPLSDDSYQLLVSDSNTEESVAPTVAPDPAEWQTVPNVDQQMPQEVQDFVTVVPEVFIINMDYNPDDEVAETVIGTEN